MRSIKDCQGRSWFQIHWLLVSLSHQIGPDRKPEARKPECGETEAQLQDKEAPQGQERPESGTLGSRPHPATHGCVVFSRCVPLRLGVPIWGVHPSAETPPGQLPKNPVKSYSEKPLGGRLRIHYPLRRGHHRRSPPASPSCLSSSREPTGCATQPPGGPLLGSPTL